MPKRSLSLKGHSTSVSLETEFWEELKRLAQEEKSSLNALVSRIDAQRSGNLSSALRLYVLKNLKEE
ncbi:MAG: ribbon-helix-helix domain-containing protein [Bdellovibrionales bacterium]